MHSPAAMLLVSFFSIVFSTTLFAHISSMAQRFGEIYRLNAEALSLGKIANGKLQDVQLREFNKRMMSDNATALKTLDDFSKRLNIKKPIIKENVEPAKFRGMRGKDFDLEFISKQIVIHKDLVGLLHEKSSGPAGYPQVNKSFKNMLKRFNAILKNAINLKSSLITKEST